MIINKYFYGDERTTFLLKTIAPDFATFKANMSENYISQYVTLDDNQLETMYMVLITNYGNSFIRQQLPSLFYNDYTNVLLNIYGKYSVLWNTIKDVYAADLLSQGSETWDENREDYTESDGVSKYAETPTEIDPATEFYDTYTNSATSNTTDRNQTVASRGNRAHTINPVEALSKALSLTDFRLDELTQEFAHLFVQIEPDIKYIYYDGGAE